MSNRRCCCGGGCNNSTCVPVRNHCASPGFLIPSVRVSASVRIPGCYEPSCETYDGGPPSTYIGTGLAGCIKCWPAYINYPDCVPCRQQVALGENYWGNANIVYTAADPRNFTATCDYSWNEGWYAEERNCGPLTAEFKCYDNTRLIDANCAFLEYITVSKSDTIGPSKWKTCNGGSVSPPVPDADAYFGELCGGCSDTPQPCCCDDCTDCKQIRCDMVYLNGQAAIKFGNIRARILQMIPCTGFTQNASEWWCGAGCSGATEDQGYSRITVEFIADIPTVAIDANTIFSTTGGLVDSSPGIVNYPRALSFKQLGLCDEDNLFYCLAQTAMVLTFRRCRKTADSQSNKCQMEKGVYELAFIGGSGSCPIPMPWCVSISGTPCNPKQMVEALEQIGWGATLEVL